MTDTPKQPGKTGRKNKPGAGRPKFVPTDAHREQVEQMVAVGTGEDDIAELVGCARMTLRKHFPKELRFGRVKKRAEVVGMAFDAARSGNAAMIKHLEVMTGIAASGQPAKYKVPEIEKPAPAEKPAKAPKLGKKEEQLLAAQNPDQGTPMGELMAARQQAAQTGKLQ